MIYFRDDQWYFSDEAYYEHGPYQTQEEAEIDLSLYVRYLETGVSD